MPADDWISDALSPEPERRAVLQRRFLRPESANLWASICRHLIQEDSRATVTVVPTWYGSKVVVWLQEDE